jgi:hypothetical protein
MVPYATYGANKCGSSIVFSEESYVCFKMLPRGFHKVCDHSIRARKECLPELRAALRAAPKQVRIMSDEEDEQEEEEEEVCTC